MKLLSCYISAFGTLRDKSYEFKDGLNCILAENGTGKTTLAVFLKAMLFGMTPSKRQSLSENEYRHYTPWQGGRFGGSLTLETEGRRYRIERFFHPDSFSLTDLSTGAPSSDFSERIGEELLDVDAEAFLHSIYMPSESRGVKSDDRISAKLNSLTGEVFDLSSYGDADRLLQEVRKEIEGLNGRGGRLPTLEGKIKERKERILTAEAAEREASLLAARLEGEAATLRDLESATRLCLRTEAEVASLTQRLEEGQRELRRLAPLFANGLPGEEDLRALSDAENDFLTEGHRLEAARLSERTAEEAWRAAEALPLPEHPAPPKQEEGPREERGAKRSFPVLTAARLSLALAVTAIALFLAFTIALPFLAFIALAFLPLIPFGEGGSAEEARGARPREAEEAEESRAYAEAMATLRTKRETLKQAAQEAAAKRREAEEGLARAEERRHSLLLRYAINESETPFSLPLYREQAGSYRTLLEKVAETGRLLEEKRGLTETLLKTTLPLLGERADAPTPSLLEPLLTRKRDALTEQTARLRGYEVAAAALAEERSKLSRLTEEADALRERRDTLDLTRALLAKAKTSLEKRYLSGISERFSHYLKALLGEEVEYDLSTALAVRFVVGGEGKENDYFSSGTRAITEVCLRLALADCLYPTSPPPLFLDDPFALLDGPRLGRAKKVLLTLSRERQILYFCAHPSRAIG